jgi:hypothetical protein
MPCASTWYPRQDSNLRFRLRRPVPYPLGHWGTLLDYRSPGQRRSSRRASGAAHGDEVEGLVVFRETQDGRDLVVVEGADRY